MGYTHPMPDFSYSYHLPNDLIARQPAVPRDAARLFVYDMANDAITFDHFLHLDTHLPKNALLVLNDTAVAPARAALKKETGGKIEALFLLNEWNGTGPIPVWLDRKANLGAKLFFNEKKFLTVAGQNEDVFHLTPNFPAKEIFSVLQKMGAMPIPKYIKGTGLAESAARKKYQTVFAAHRPVSVAAPTASLHFTDRVFRKLDLKGIRKTFLTLDVGRGTFAPLKEESLQSGLLHEESLFIPRRAAQLIRAAKEKSQPVVTVGTTATRAVESSATELLSKKTIPSDIRKSTRIFIRPPHHFGVTDILMTNFHLPDTSLMMLVQAFLQDKKSKRNVVDLYEIAIQEKFRFFSFGDTMLIK